MEICDDIVVFNNGKNTGSIDFEKDGKNQDEIIGLITGDIEVTSEKHKNEDISEETKFEVKDLQYQEILKHINLSVKKMERFLELEGYRDKDRLN